MEVNRRYLLLLAGYASLLVFIAGSADFDIRLWVFDVADAIPFGDKIGHLVLSGLLSFLLNTAVHCRTFPLLGVRIRIGSLAACLLVLTEELSQIWFASRNVDLCDLLFNMVGIYLFSVLATWNRRIATERQPG